MVCIVESILVASRYVLRLRVLVAAKAVSRYVLLLQILFAAKAVSWHVLRLRILVATRVCIANTNSAYQRAVSWHQAVIWHAIMACIVASICTCGVAMLYIYGMQLHNSTYYI